MSEQEQVEAHVPITISIDVDALLASELGWTTYNAGDYESPEPGYAPGGNGRIIDVVAVKLAEAIKADVRDAVKTVVKERALMKVDELLDEVMAEKLRLTDEFGHPKSEETSIREQMIKAMGDRLDAPVDRDGRRLSDSYGKKFTYLQWRIEQTAALVLDKEMSARLTTLAAQIKESATKLVSERIAKALGQS